MAELLLLEDDPAIAQTLRFALEREGFALRHCAWLHEARAALAERLPALLILDVGLPDGNGLDLCREIRASGSAALQQLPLIVLSARSEEFDRVLGLELGADDYLAKPFSPRELVARVRALLRRAPAAPQPAASPFVIEAEGSRIRFHGQLLDLTRRELGLLKRLLAAPERIHSREVLLDAVWGSEADSIDRTVDTHIKTLRAKLRAVRPETELIRTHRGLGYSLE
ncbi:two-component system response regulator CreB [Paucibacter sp. R3-3]|uniref:Two-component system response regulator CreB n=1 Tax=Roseateles agri TaxID=3098619 RepID=A0ABU5DBN8_9BURK|nr:two-component system response regulator CreB [Paucibacter sp. R3-3]MDY0743668.1 two-component system response regulator CreB [Paucibacter sp. R3-3]